MAHAACCAMVGATWPLRFSRLWTWKIIEHWADGSTKFLASTCLVYDCSYQLEFVLISNTRMKEVNVHPVKPGALSRPGDQLDNVNQGVFHQIHEQLDGLPSIVRYLYIVVSTWDGVKLREIQSPPVRLPETGGDDFCRYNVDGAHGNMTAVLMRVLHRCPERSTSQVSCWALEAVSEVGHAAAHNYGLIKISMHQDQLALVE